jgi:stage II sporulation protein D
MNRVNCAAIAAVVIASLFMPSLSAASAKDKYYADSVELSIPYFISEAAAENSDKYSYFELASVLKEFGRNKEAYDCYTSITRMAANENRAVFEMGKTYYFLGADNLAEEEFKSLVYKNIVNWEVYYWWGSTLLDEKKYDEAEVVLKKSVEADKNKNIIYVKLAQLYEAKGDIENAILNYKLAIKHDKTYTELNRKIAGLYEMKGEKISAYSYWQKVENVDAKDETAVSKIKAFMDTIPFLQQKAKEYVEIKKVQRARIVPPDKKNVQNSSQIPIVRVGLLEGVTSINFKCGSNFDFVNDRYESIFKGEKLKEYFFQYDRQLKKPFFSDGIQKIYFKKDMYVTRYNPESSTTIYNVQYAEGFYWSEKKDTTYRGDFLIRFQNNGFTMINILNLEEYLYGVVPSEIPPTWPEEALKAQAVAARTYTIQHMGRHEKNGFDVCSQQHCAVYTGLNGEHKNTNKAVDDTRAQILYGSNYKILNTFYSHCCGGHTQDVNEVWGLKKVASLGGVYDGKHQDWDFPLSPFYLEEFVRTLPDDYCKATGEGETSFRWIRYLDAESLRYYLDKKGDVGRIMEIKPVRRAKGGALLKVYIKGDKGSETFGFDSMRNALGKIRSNVIKWEYIKDKNGYIKEMYIYGAGWGHGVGMCQRGLKGMAEANNGYESMLYHYFPGSYIKNKY